MIQLAFRDITHGEASANGSVFDSIIQWKTSSPLVHVELTIGSGNPARCYSSVPGDGVRWTYLPLLTPAWRLVSVGSGAAAEEAMVTAVADRYVGHKYDWLGIIGFEFAFGEHDDKDKFCSEICTLVLQEALGLFPHVKSWCTSPADLYHMATSAR